MGSESFGAFAKAYMLRCEFIFVIYCRQYCILFFIVKDGLACFSISLFTDILYYLFYFAVSPVVIIIVLVIVIFIITIVIILIFFLIEQIPVQVPYKWRLQRFLHRVLHFYMDPSHPVLLLLRFIHNQRKE